ncbi:hypothetical protein CB1_064113017 [Camelus ferus]|nr:hypothetical protein CB1_064113017 [Camelus ferus]
MVSFFLFIIFVVYTMLPFNMRDAIIASVLTSSSHTIVLSVCLSAAPGAKEHLVWQTPAATAGQQFHPLPQDLPQTLHVLYETRGSVELRLPCLLRYSGPKWTCPLWAHLVAVGLEVTAVVTEVGGSQQQLGGGD